MWWGSGGVISAARVSVSGSSVRLFLEVSVDRKREVEEKIYIFTYKLGCVPWTYASTRSSEIHAHVDVGTASPPHV